MKKISKWVLKIKKDIRGQVFVLAVGMLPVLFGMGAMSVDVGYMYVARSQMQTASDAGALAGAQILAGGGTQSTAQTQAINFANLNLANSGYLQGATPVVTFPGGNQIRVNINHPNLGLLLAPVIGINTASVQTNAAAQFGAAITVPPGTASPFAIYCQKPGGCSGGDLTVGELFEKKYRHCGNQFGSSSSKCSYEPKTVPDNEVFLFGVSFDHPDVYGCDISSNTALKNRVLNNYEESVSIGQTAYALPGTREGVQAAIEERLTTYKDGQYFLVPVVEALPAGSSPHNIKVVDFVMIRIDGYYPKKGKKPDQLDFQIVQSYVPGGTSGTPGQGQSVGLGIGSIQTVNLTR
jgi:hypothetical protein